MDAESKQKLLRNTISALEEGVLVVEGKRDQEALQKAGVQALTVAVRAEKLESIVRKIASKALAGKQIVLLVDFDQEGRRKEAELREALLNAGVKVHGGTRANFRRLFRVSTIEQLPAALEKLKEEIANNGK